MDTFFDFSKPKVIRNIQVSGIDVKYIPDHNKRASPKKRPLYGTEYAENCREFEMENLKLVRCCVIFKIIEII